MIIVRRLKLVTTPEQHAALLRTMRAMNAASTTAARSAFGERRFAKFDIQRLVYRRIRAEHGLLSQMAIRVIANVAACFARDRTVCPTFRDDAGVSYDSRILSLKRGVVSIATVAGRIRLPVEAGVQTPTRLDRKIGNEANLVLRDGVFYLHVCVDLPTNADLSIERRTDDFLGVDLGIVNIATDSDGNIMSGAHLNALRHRHARLRKKLQAIGTKSAKRLLRKRRRKEGRFARHTNHCISKALVARAQGTDRGIALEDLEGIRDRVTVRKAQRRALHSWSFHQLRQFVTYKAQLAGVLIALVDPRNTSRTCSACGHVDKSSRKSQSMFECVRCGHADHADHNAAVNIRDRARAQGADVLCRADVNRPHASGGAVVELHGVSQARSLGL